MPTPLPSLDIDPLPYATRLATRTPDDIDTVVIHCTELPDLATARDYGERVLYAESQTGNSGHFYIDRDGSVRAWVDIGRIAHHVRGWNERSVGIELVNRGRFPHWTHSAHQQMTEPYPEAQIAGLMGLLRLLRLVLPNLSQIAGHEALDHDMVDASDDARVQVRRKLDPGPLFPWDRVMASCPLRRIETSA